MKKILLIIAILGLSGCASFGRGIVEAILDKDKKEDTRQCEIQGDKIRGIEYYFNQGKTVKVMMIHGVGTHTPGYATRIRENLAKSLNLTVLSRKPKNITLINPDDEKTNIGTLQIFRLQNEAKTQELLFYELTWSDITSQQKKILDYDTSSRFGYKRAAFNHSMKKFFDDTVPDPMIYLLDKDNLILNATKQSTCWMLGYNWNDIKDEEHKVCKVSSSQQISDLNKENIIYVTHSLGSRILMDSINDIVEEVSNADIKSNKKAQMIINELKNKNITVFMLANQLPILQIGREKPPVTNKIKQYCSKKGANYNQRIFKKVNIIAFSDPNDLLSYEIPQRFVDEYIDSRMCPTVTNIDINISEEISAFGLGVVNPLTAHTMYDNDDRVIEIISKGTYNIEDNTILSKRCRFIELD